MSEPESWCYVASDPKQPGAAFAITVDDGSYLAEMHRTLAEWAKRGGVPTRMKLSEGVAMVKLWKRPEKKKRVALTPNASLTCGLAATEVNDEQR